MKITCPLCFSNKVSFFFNRPNIPTMQNLLFFSRKEALNIDCVDLEFMLCDECTFVFNKNFSDDKTKYNFNYNNSQVYSKFFLNHMENMANKINDSNSEPKKTIIEVGCGKGDFLKLLVSRNKKLKAFGFDKTYEINEIDKSLGIIFIQDFYGYKYEHIKGDTLILRHVIEHIPDPYVFLKSITKSIKENPNAEFFLEMPSTEWILKNNVVWDFFYEHCSYFSEISLRCLIERLGFQVVEIAKVFGGQYLWGMGNLSRNSYPKKIINQLDKDNFKSLCKSYIPKQRKIFKTISNKVKQIAISSRVVLWGAGAKGSTFLNLFDKRGEYIDFVIDINPSKQNKYIGGTGHEIKSFEKSLNYKINTIIVLNLNYKEEIVNLLIDKGINDINIVVL